MRFTEKSEKQEVSEFLECKFGHIPEGIVPNFREEIKDAKRRHRGRQPNAEFLSLYAQLDNRAAGVTIDRALEDLLAQTSLDGEEDNFDTLRRGYTRYLNRTDKLLNPERSYGNEDFNLAILAKCFDIAAAIFSVAGKKEKAKIVKNLNNWA